MFEEKTLIRSHVNASQIDEKRRVMEKFGWVLQNSEIDKRRNVTRYYYRRDLSAPGVQRLKDNEKQYEDAKNALVFANLNIDYCESHKRTLIKSRSSIARYIIPVVIVVLCLGLVYLVRNTDFLTNANATFTFKDEDIEITKDFYYKLEDGKTLFGRTELDYAFIVDFVTYAMLGIGFIAAFVMLVFVKNSIQEQSIRKAEREFLEERQEYFRRLAADMRVKLQRLI